MNGQIDFDEYLRLKNKCYALQCRHFRCDYCYIKKGEPDQCPCEDYEERRFCDGCKYQRRAGQRIAKECFDCYRFWFNPDVKTKDLEDKWTY